MVSVVILFMRSFTRSMLEFDLLAIFIVKYTNSVSFSFLFPCFLFSLRLGPNSFFSIKANRRVF